MRGSVRAAAAVILLGAGLLTACGPVPGSPEDLARFENRIVYSGLQQPTAVAFAPDGRVFVAEQSGLIKVFDNLADTSPTTFADLRTNVHHFWDRGLLGLAVDPQFPARPYVYVSYTYDAAIGGTAPRWGSPGQTFDPCPTPPGPTADGCVVSGRLSRLTASGNTATSEEVLINDWCQQYPSHSMGALAFGPDGALYMSAGDGASYGVRRLGTGREPREPLWRPRPGGRRAAGAGPAHRRRPHRAQRRCPAPRSEYGHGHGRQPAHRQQRPERPADHRRRDCGTRSGSRSAPARKSSGSATSARAATKR